MCRTHRREGGFSLVELMIVVAVIAVLAGIALPNLLVARLRANETSAVATMRAIAACQSQFQACAKADTDGDGCGEYATFRDLSAGVAVRTNRDGTNVGGTTLYPPRLSSLFTTLTPTAEVQRAGYLFKIFLPGPGGSGVGEVAMSTTNTLESAIDPDLAETYWCCYAWPSTYAQSGNRTFFMNQRGDILQVETSNYTALGAFNSANAGTAFIRATGSLTNITANAAVGTVARDNRRWRSVD